MEYTKESTQVENQQAFTFMLHYDWEYKYIWLSKKTAKGPKIRITTKDIPISTAEKNKFYYSRSGWATIPEIGINKPCSYVNMSNVNIFNYWKQFMYNRYMNLKHREEVINNK